MISYCIYRFDENNNKISICGSTLSKAHAEGILRKDHPEFNDADIVWYEPIHSGDPGVIPPIVEGKIMVGAIK